MYTEFMSRGTNINAKAYCETLNRIVKVIKGRCPGKLSTGFVFLHDNASVILLMS